MPGLEYVDRLLAGAVVARGHWVRTLLDNIIVAGALDRAFSLGAEFGYAGALLDEGYGTFNNRWMSNLDGVHAS